MKSIWKLMMACVLLVAMAAFIGCQKTEAPEAPAPAEQPAAAPEAPAPADVNAPAAEVNEPAEDVNAPAEETTAPAETEEKTGGEEAPATAPAE